jgi:hypothetical protein
MWKIKTSNTYTQMRADRFFNGLYPGEEHGLEGDCKNPKCDYVFTNDDEKEMYQNGGWFTCPNCGTVQNPMEEPTKNQTRAKLTPGEMGDIGEKIVERLHTIPSLGEITWTSNLPQFPIDMIAGPFGVEIKTNHSESQPRFKLGGGMRSGDRSGTLAGKLQYCEKNNLRPALVGVRLNFYTDRADVFVRPDSFTDTWIGSPTLQHVASVDFADLNPYKHPENVPPPTELPDDSDIPF